MNLRYKFQILEKIPQHLLIDHFPTVDLSSVGSTWNRRYRNFSKKLSIIYYERRFPPRCLRSMHQRRCIKLVK